MKWLLLHTPKHWNDLNIRAAEPRKPKLVEVQMMPLKPKENVRKTGQETKRNDYWKSALYITAFIFTLIPCGLVVRVSGYRSRGPGFDSRRFQIF
jgi:hypothetical protein